MITMTTDQINAILDNASKVLHNGYMYSGVTAMRNTISQRGSLKVYRYDNGNFRVRLSSSRYYLVIA